MYKIDNNLLYTSGDSAQCSLWPQWEENPKKEGIYVNIKAKSLCCTLETNNELIKSKNIKKIWIQVIHIWGKYIKDAFQSTDGRKTLVWSNKGTNTLVFVSIHYWGL